MTTQPVINTQIARNIISLVDFCYRKGVNDAYRIADEGLAREFIDKLDEVGVYGFLNDDGVTMGWQEWTLRLMAQSRMTSWNGAMNRYFELMGKLGQNYLGVFIPVSCHFYAKGIEDYLDAPHATDIAVFNGRSRVYWTPNGVKTVKNRQYVDDIMLCCFDLKRRDEAIWSHDTIYDAKKKGALKPTQYDWFIRALGLCMTKKAD